MRCKNTDKKRKNVKFVNTKNNTYQMKKILFSIITVLAVLSCGKDGGAAITGTWQLTDSTITDGKEVQRGPVQDSGQIVRFYSDGTGWGYSTEIELNGDFTYEQQGGSLFVTPKGEEGSISFDVDTIKSSKLVLVGHAVYHGTELTLTFTFKKIKNMNKDDYYNEYGKY